MLDPSNSLYQIKLDKLRQDLAVGVKALDRGQSTIYDEASISALLEKIKARGCQRIGKQYEELPFDEWR